MQTTALEKAIGRRGIFYQNPTVVDDFDGLTAVSPGYALDLGPESEELLETGVKSLRNGHRNLKSVGKRSVASYLVHDASIPIPKGHTRVQSYLQYRLQGPEAERQIAKVYRPKFSVMRLPHVADLLR